MAALSDRAIHVFDAETGKANYTVGRSAQKSAVEKSEVDFSFLRFSADGKRIIFGRQGEVSLLSRATKKQRLLAKVTLKAEAGCDVLAVPPDEKLVAAG